MDTGVSGPKPEKPVISRRKYLWLAFFFGGFGVHNFAAGYRWRGLFQLLLTIFGCGIGAVVVLFWFSCEMLLVRKDAKGNRMEGGKLLAPILVTSELILTAVLAIGFAALLSLLASENEPTACKEKLRDVGLALHEYAKSHHRQFPAGSGQLGLCRLNLSPEYFSCPCGEGGFLYLDGAAAGPEKLPVVIDPPWNHQRSKALLVLYSDGTVWKFCPDSDINSLPELLTCLLAGSKNDAERKFLLTKIRENRQPRKKL